MASTIEDPDLKAALAANTVMPAEDRAALAAAFTGIADHWPRIVAQQEDIAGEMAHLVARKVVMHARSAIRIGARMDSLEEVVARLVDGEIARQITLSDFHSAIPPEAACAAGCFFCCVIVDRITATEAEITRVAAQLKGLPEPGFHPDACPSLDPDTRACRAYEVRPMVCRDVYSEVLDPCRQSFEEGRIRHDTRFMNSGGQMIFYGINWLLVTLGRPELLKVYDLKASLRAGGTLIPLPG